MGSLLYSAATKLSTLPVTTQAIGTVARYITSGELHSQQQLQAALAYCERLGSKGNCR